MVALCSQAKKQPQENRVYTEVKEKCQGKRPWHILLYKHHFTAVEEEVAGNEVFTTSGGELVLEGEVLMTCQDATKQGLLTQIGNEVTGDRVVLLLLVLAINSGHA